MFSIINPAHPLQPFIECYWLNETQSVLYSRQRTTLPVDGRADLMFTFGRSYEVLRASGEPGQSHEAAHLNAQRRFPLTVTQDLQHQMVGIRFRPGGLAAFLPMPAVELSNLSVEINALFGAAASILEYRLFDHLGDSAVQIACLDDFFLNRLVIQAGYDGARATALRIEAARGQIRLEQLSRDFGYSLRTIDRQFAQIFGYTPKFYARIIRFHHALNLLKTQRFDLTTVSFQSGYYDQSHFIKDCWQFTGRTPQQHFDVMRSREFDASYHVRFLQSAEDVNRYSFLSSHPKEDRSVLYEL